MRVVSIAGAAKEIEDLETRSKAGVFTPAEREYCEGRRATTAQHYAVRLAAKSAAQEALGGGMFHEIEICHDSWGAPRFALTGEAAACASGPLLVSLTHDGDLAIAVVAVAE